MIRVGVAGWSYRDWEGRVYPRPRPRGFDPLSYLARHLDTVEINTTFYREVPAAVVASWVARVASAPRFRFTAKLHRSFTHEREPGVLRPYALRPHLGGLAPIREAGRLGALLLQFPHSFHDGEAARDDLARLLDLLAGWPVVVEVRHASWLRGPVLAWMAARAVGFCNVDQPSIGDAIGPTALATSAVGYVRLHGRNARDWFRPGAGRDARYDYLYDDDELRPWVERIRGLSTSVADAYVVANNHFEGQAVVNALELRAALEGGPVDVPPDLVRSYPRLRSISRHAPAEARSLPLT